MLASVEPSKIFWIFLDNINFYQRRIDDNKTFTHRRRFTDTFKASQIQRPLRDVEWS